MVEGLIVSIFLRSLIFNFLFYSWCLICFVICLPLLACPLSWLRWARHIWLSGIKGLLHYVMGLQYRVIGEEYISASPAIYAVKHQSAWETLTLLLLIPNGVFVLKKELLWLPFLGWYLQKTGQIAIDRGNGTKALRAILKRADQAVMRGYSPIIFPEGTRVAPGHRKSYLPGIAALYQNLQLSVIPVAHNSGLFWPRRSFIKKPGMITLQFLPPIAPGLGRKEFIAKLEKEIETASDSLIA